MLQWIGAKRDLSDQDVCMLLTSKFTMRVDIQRSVVEYAAKVNEKNAYVADAPESKRLKLDNTEIVNTDHLSGTDMDVNSGELKYKID